VQNCDIEGEISKIISKGSHTSEFLLKNFGERSFPDTVYVSATPQLRAHEIESNFYATVPVWEYGWDETLRTVPPEVMMNETLKAHKDYPNKKIISHFLQPHYPFIGTKGRELDHGTVTGGGVLSEEREIPSVWELLEAGKVSQKVVKEAYLENLNIVFPYIEELISNIDGKIVITSDHGNSYGKMGVYGHPPGTFLNCLVEVPWLELPFKTRRDIISERVQTIDVSGDIDQKLRDLGYM